jgi:glycine hydroxymethyltransferase
MVTSGIRIGTPACTTRGFSEVECQELANWICDILDALELDFTETSRNKADATIDAVRTKVTTLCAKHPVYR